MKMHLIKMPLEFLPLSMSSAKIQGNRNKRHPFNTNRGNVIRYNLQFAMIPFFIVPAKASPSLFKPDSIISCYFLPSPMYFCSEDLTLLTRQRHGSRCLFFFFLLLFFVTIHAQTSQSNRVDKVEKNASFAS